MADNAQQGRNAALAVLKEAMRDLNRLVAKGNPNMRVMQVKYEKVKDAKDELLKKHIVYGEKAKKDLDSDEMTDWVTPHMDDANDLIDDVFLLLDAEDERLKNASSDAQKTLELDFQKVKLNNDRVVAKKQSETEEKVIRDAVTAMMVIVDDDDKNSQEDALLVQAQLDELDMFLESQNKSWNTLKELYADDANELNVIAATESSLRSHLTDGRCKAVAFVKKLTTSVSTDPDDTASVGSRSSASGEDHHSSSLRLQKVSLPSFTGDVRSYARFKGNFLKVVQPQYKDETHLMYVLKEQCLKGNAKTLVENVQEMKDIWERLDDKFGHGIDIVNLVLKDVKNLSIDKKDQQQGLVNLVDTVERGMQDLINIDAKAEMANSYTVSLIEKKLPMRILTKWLDQDCKKVGAERFDELVEFLKVERKQAQRLIQLRTKDVQEKESKDNNNRKKDNQQYANYLNNNNNGNQRDGRINPNNSCLIHPQSNHLTRDCRDFRRKTAAERGQLVKNENGCRLCLSKSHIGKPCPFENKWQACNINGCTGKHNRLVHDSGVVGISCHVRGQVIVQDVRVETELDSETVSEERKMDETEALQTEVPLEITETEITVPDTCQHDTLLNTTPDTMTLQTETAHVQYTDTHNETVHIETSQVTTNTNYGNQICSATTTTYRYESKNNTLLLIQEIMTTSGELTAFWDDGSTLTLVSRSYVQRMNLKGVSVTYSLRTV